jgi:hypothetical protein
MMKVRIVLIGLLTLAIVMPGLVLAQSPQAQKAPTCQGMYSGMSSEQFNQLCTNQGFMGGLTPEQRKEIDAEWQRRVPTMTPEEIQRYYPAGRRYYP